MVVLLAALAVLDPGDGGTCADRQEEALNQLGSNSCELGTNSALSKSVGRGDMLRQPEQTEMMLQRHRVGGRRADKRPGVREHTSPRQGSSRNTSSATLADGGWRKRPIRGLRKPRIALEADDWWNGSNGCMCVEPSKGKAFKPCVTQEKQKKSPFLWSDLTLQYGKREDPRTATCTTL